MGKYPPIGRRGFSSTNASVGFQVVGDQLEVLRQVNDSTHLMVQFESDEGYEELDKILSHDGIDMIGVGPGDWSIDLGISGAAAEANLNPKLERVLTRSVSAGKIVVMGPGSSQQIRRFRELGARVFIVGVDVAMRRQVLAQSLRGLKDEL